MLRQPDGKQGLDYLKGRKLSDETIRKFGLGCSSKRGNDLYKYLKSKGYSDSLLKESRLMQVDDEMACAIILEPGHVSHYGQPKPDHRIRRTGHGRCKA